MQSLLLLLLRLKKKKVRPLQPLALKPPLQLPQLVAPLLLASLQPEPQDQLESSIEVRNPSLSLRIRSNFCVEVVLSNLPCQPRHSRDGHRRGLTQGL